MKFEKSTLAGQECYISGRYKITQYERWYASFKPVGWGNWGNRCEETNYGSSVEYETKTEARAACERHYAKFGNNPNPSDKIKVL